METTKSKATKTKTKSKTVKAKTQDELNELMAKQCSFSEAVKGVKEELKRIYPEELFICFAAEHEKPGSNNGVVSFHEYGDEDLIDDLGTLAMKHDMRACKFIQNAYLNWMMDQSPEGKSEEFNRIRDSVLLYAQSKGYDITKFKYHKKIQYQLGQSIDPADAEIVLSLLEKEIERVKQMRSPLNTITLLKAEIKRLKKQGDMTMAAKKQVELDAILDAERLRKEAEIRKAENLAKKRAAAKKATAAWVEKCRLKREEKEEAIRKAEQAELDRQRGYQQFQPGKAAKKRMQKLAERQAERNARKKKASEGNTFHAVKNACSLGHG